MSGVFFFFFLLLKIIFLLSPFEKLHHSLFYLSILLLTFFSSTMFQMHLRPFLHFFLGSMFLIHKEQHSKFSFLYVSSRECRWCEITIVTDLYHCIRLNNSTYQQKCTERSRHVDCTQVVESCHRPREYAAGEREKVLGS